MIGMTPSEFWRLTPWMLRACVEGFQRRCEIEHNRAAFMMYHNALLSQTTKKFPPLDRFLYGTKKAVKIIDEAAIMARFQAYQQRLAGDSSS